jgi:hypothetical protein
MLKHRKQITKNFKLVLLTPFLAWQTALVQTREEMNETAASLVKLFLLSSSFIDSTEMQNSETQESRRM